MNALAQARRLANSEVRLGAMGFGCMGLVGWYGERDDEESRATLRAALDKGIVHFDTAASYQVGENEKFVGEALRARRTDIFLATKFGLGRTPEGGTWVDNKPAAIKASCDASLKRLGFDHVDLFYLHRIDPQVPIEDSVGALADLVKAGKIRYIGLSECSERTLRRACAVHHVAAVQSEYSLWSRDPELGILQACEQLGTSFVAYSPLGRGFLAGNFKRVTELPPGDARRGQPRFQDAAAAHNDAIVTAIRELAYAKSATPAQVAIAWVIAQSPVISVIPGMKTRAHLTDNLGALSLVLTPGEQATLKSRIDALSVKGERHPAAMMNVIDR